MKERGILMQAESVRGILAGAKTHTRRVIKPPRIWEKQFYQKFANEWELQPDGKWQPYDEDGYQSCAAIKCPYGVIGDKLWVRETWARTMATAYRQSPGVVFTPNPEDPTVGVVYRAGWTRVKPGPWKSSMHMPRWASRILLEVKEIRVERLQDIKPIDVVAEGVYEPTYNYTNLESIGAILRFESVWNSINEKRGFGWDVNPWVWVVVFEMIKEKVR